MSENKLTLSDINTCPYCNSDQEPIHIDTDEDEFELYTNNGHCYINYQCSECKKYYRTCFEFEYKITDHWTRS